MIILASKSPRRKEILDTLGFEYRCVPADTDETPVEGMSPADTVMLFSERKAFAVRGEAEYGDIVLGMDTMVCIDGKLLGKPKDEEDAFRMLKMLSGRKHNVITGYTVICGNKWESGCVSTDVYFRPLTDSEIRWYMSTKEPMDKTGGLIWNTEKPRYYWEDKAGGYGIQDPFGMRAVKRIEGDYYNVVGLPVSHLLQVLKKFGIE